MGVMLPLCLNTQLCVSSGLSTGQRHLIMKYHKTCIIIFSFFRFFSSHEVTILPAPSGVVTDINLLLTCCPSHCHSSFICNPRHIIKVYFLWRTLIKTFFFIFRDIICLCSQLTTNNPNSWPLPDQPSLNFQYQIKYHGLLQHLHY